jgi:two-component system response regulator
MERTILLVEDEADDEELTLRALKQNRITNKVIVARDGAEALEFLTANKHATRGESILPQLVVLDLRLPKIDGFEVLKCIRADDQTRLLPVVILASSNEDRDKLRGYELGANSFIRKPVDFTQFAKAGGQLAMYWLRLNQCAPAARRSA